jgi:hypothetical protein
MLGFSGKQFSFDFSLSYYHVTTLYFETFTEEDLCRNGFSKENKSQQLQIVMALIVIWDYLSIKARPYT